MLTTTRFREALLEAAAVPSNYVPDSQPYRDYAVAMMCFFLAGQGSLNVSPVLTGPKFPVDAYFRLGVMGGYADEFADTRFVFEDIDCVIHMGS